MIYLTGSAGPIARDAGWHTADLGLLVQPRTQSLLNYAERFAFWAADNGCFTRPEAFDLAEYLRMIERGQAAGGECLFATAPDVVCDPVATLQRSLPVLPELRRAGVPAALVAQDGIELLAIPWDDFDVLFLGGSTDWKCGVIADAEQAFAWFYMIWEAHRRGKWIHMGRVNTRGRLFHAALSLACRSADGNQFAFGPRANVARLLRWMNQIDEINAADGRQPAYPRRVSPSTERTNP